jgi:hypothetical protein
MSWQKRPIWAVAAVAILAATPSLAAELRFWNLTSVTIVDLRLAPAGTERWSANQCDHDPDKAVDADERLKLSAFAPGTYDVKLRDKTGRRCTVRNVALKGDGHYAFSIADADLTDCQH